MPQAHGEWQMENCISLARRNLAAEPQQEHYCRICYQRGSPADTGSVVDPNNAVVPNASVTLSNAITGYKRTVTTGTDGTFRFNDVPPNNYQITASGAGFQPATEAITVRTSVPISLKLALTVGTATETSRWEGHSAINMAHDRGGSLALPI